MPEPQKAVREMLRVVRPGGTIAIINHFRSPRPMIARLVDQLDPVTRKLGWSTRLAVEDLLADSSLELKARYKTSEASLFTILVGQAPLAGAGSAGA